MLCRAAQAAGKPFFIHVTPLMVHGGTCAGPMPNGAKAEDWYKPWDPCRHACPNPRAAAARHLQAT